MHCFVVSALGSEAKVAILATEPNAIRLQLVELRKKIYHVIPESYVVVFFNFLNRGDLSKRHLLMSPIIVVSS